MTVDLYFCSDADTCPCPFFSCFLFLGAQRDVEGEVKSCKPLLCISHVPVLTALTYFSLSRRVKKKKEHLVVNEIGHVVRARTVRRCVENENSGSDVIKLNATHSYLKPDGDDLEVRERWTPTPGYRACESAHANKHLVRCESRGRNPPTSSESRRKTDTNTES